MAAGDVDPSLNHLIVLAPTANVRRFYLLSSFFFSSGNRFSSGIFCAALVLYIHFSRSYKNIYMSASAASTPQLDNNSLSAELMTTPPSPTDVFIGHNQPTTGSVSDERQRHYLKNKITPPPYDGTLSIYFFYGDERVNLSH